MCSRRNEYWMDFIQDGEVVAGFPTTKKESRNYAQLRSKWVQGKISLERLREITIALN